MTFTALLGMVVGWNLVFSKPNLNFNSMKQPIMDFENGVIVKIYKS